MTHDRPPFWTLRYSTAVPARHQPAEIVVQKALARNACSSVVARSLLAIFLTVGCSSVEYAGFGRGGTDVEIVGPEEVVFDWFRDRCDDGDFPDLPVRAFRDHLGRVQLLRSHYRTRRLIGPTLDEVKPDCQVVIDSRGGPEPSDYDGHQWLAAVHTEDGQHLVGLVHNEHQGHRYPGQCPSRSYQRCWYNSITWVESHDGGESYVRPPVPSQRLASLPYRYQPDTGPSGYFEPSNIVTRDGYAYMLVRTMTTEAQEWGTCILRSATPSDPGSWRAWDGSGFSVQFIDPYRTVVTEPQRHVCAPISRDQIQTMNYSLQWNTAVQQWFLVGISADWSQTQRRAVWGIYYSWSADLIQWSPRRLLLAGVVPWTFQCGDPDPLHYPSVIDPASPSRTFATMGARAYLYFTRFNYLNCRPTRSADLIRVPIVITTASDRIRPIEHGVRERRNRLEASAPQAH